MSDKPCKATPPDDLLEQLLDCRVPKSEREHFAASKIEQLQAELAREEKGSRLLEQIIEDQKNTYVGSKKYWEDKIKQLQAELAVEKHEYEMLRQGFNALDSDIANLQAENTKLQSRLDRIANLQGDEINRAWAIANGEEV